MDEKITVFLNRRHLTEKANFLMWTIIAKKKTSVKISP